MIRIATWNVNSIKARIGNVLDWLTTAAPDVVLLRNSNARPMPSRGWRSNPSATTPR